MGTPHGTRKHEEAEDGSREHQDEEGSIEQLAKKSEKTGNKKGRELPSPKAEMKGLGKRSISDGDAAKERKKHERTTSYKNEHQNERISRKEEGHRAEWNYRRKRGTRQTRMLQAKL